MRRRTLGNGGPAVSAIAYGCMGLSGAYGTADDVESTNLLRGAVDNGVTFFDTANVYGDGHNEELVGRALRPVRDRVVIATKGGFVKKPDGGLAIDGNPDRIRTACEASLRRLGMESVDLYYLHRVDPEVPVEDTIGAMAMLVAEGKVRHIGLSQTTPGILERATAVHPVAALQSEYSLWVREPETDVMPACDRLGIAFIPFCPLGRGFLTRRIASLDGLADDDLRRTVPRLRSEHMARNAGALEALDRLASAKRCTAGQLALAWLLHKGENVIPIPGTRRPDRLAENAGAAELALAPDEVAALDSAFPVGFASGSSRPDFVEVLETSA
jgi:aryl-alcohol dehydrogenase-like predicted oxidoreductase